MKSYIFIYDISSESENYSKILKTMRQYTNHLQKSVFVGELSRSGLTKLIREMYKFVDSKKDSFIVYELKGNKEFLKIGNTNERGIVEDSF